MIVLLSLQAAGRFRSFRNPDFELVLTLQPSRRSVRHHGNVSSHSWSPLSILLLRFRWVAMEGNSCAPLGLCRGPKLPKRPEHVLKREQALFTCNLFSGVKLQDFRNQLLQTTQVFHFSIDKSMFDASIGTCT